MANKKSVLQEAEELIHGARQRMYSHPFEDFSRTAKMLTGLLSKKLKDGVEIDPEEVALIQVCVKLSRLIATPGHHDSMVDIPGYMGTYEMVMDWKDKLATERSIADEDFIRVCDEIKQATSNLIYSKLERERSNQNLRAINVNPVDGSTSIIETKESDNNPSKTSAELDHDHSL